LREYCHVLHATAALVAAAEIEGEAEGDKLVVGAGVVAEVASDDGLTLVLGVPVGVGREVWLGVVVANSDAVADAVAFGSLEMVGEGLRETLGAPDAETLGEVDGDELCDTLGKVDPEMLGEVDGDELLDAVGSPDGLGAGASGTCSCVTVQPLLRLVRTKAA
jgi:hypothetical protein